MTEEKIKLVVTGCCGRMGSLVLSLAATTYADRYNVIGAIEHEGHPNVGKNLDLNGRKIVVSDKIEDFLSYADLIIEFTTPEASILHTVAASQAGVPMVIGTTGFSEDQFAQLKLLSKHTPIFWSPNMSLGVFAYRKALVSFISILNRLGLPLESNDIKIHETHHINKKDSPSGTAKQLALDISSLIKHVVNPKDIISTREGEEIGFHSVNIKLPMEEVTFQHRATDRATFAAWALLWGTHVVPFKNQPQFYRFYTVEDMIDLAINKEASK